MINWTTIIVTFLTSCIPAFITYLVTRNQTSAKIKEIQEQSKSEIERLKTEYDLKLQSDQNAASTQFANSLLNGDLKINELKEVVSGLGELQKAVKNINS